MGKGDIRSKRGKRFAGSFGNSRPQKPDKNSRTVAINTQTTIVAKPSKKNNAQAK